MKSVHSTMAAMRRHLPWTPMPSLFVAKRQRGSRMPASNISGRLCCASRSWSSSSLAQRGTPTGPTVIVARFFRAAFLRQCALPCLGSWQIALPMEATKQSCGQAKCADYRQSLDSGNMDAAAWNDNMHEHCYNRHAQKKHAAGAVPASIAVTCTLVQTHLGKDYTHACCSGKLRCTDFRYSVLHRQSTHKSTVVTLGTYMNGLDTADQCQAKTAGLEPFNT